MSEEMTNVPLLDVGRGNQPLRDEFMQKIGEVIDSGRFLFGPDVTELENEIAELSQTRHAVSCASGSDALLLALMVHGIGPGDEVIVPSFTFFATVSCVTRLGATPVFADIRPDTFNVDVQKVAEAITSRTRAIIPVHLFGQCAEMDQLCRIAAEHDIPVIEDAAQAIGAAYNGRVAGSWGTIGCISFYPTKNLGGMGDGGMLTTNDAEIADQLRLFAGHGMRPRYYHQVVGINSRLDTFQAAVLRVKLRHLQQAVRARQENARRYDEMFRDRALDAAIELPARDEAAYHVWNQYSIRVPAGARDRLREHLQRQGVGAEIYYPVPMHQQKCFEDLGYAACHLPETERASREILNLPIFPELTETEQQRVVDAVDGYFADRRRAAA